jgi:hypothetical protein
MADFLTIADENDKTAQAVHEALTKKHGTSQTKFVSNRDLVSAPSWKHQIPEKKPSKAVTEIQLQDGTTIFSTEVRVVFNRLLQPPADAFSLFSKRDQNYAQIETQALWISWLYSLPCPVINKINRKGLFPQNRTQAQWLFLASKAGLPTRTYSFTTNQIIPSNSQKQTSNQLQATNAPQTILIENSQKTQKALIVGENILGDFPKEQFKALRKLGKLSECDLLEISFGHFKDNQGKSQNTKWLVCGCDPYPQTTDEDVVSAISKLLEIQIKQPEVTE